VCRDDPILPAPLTVERLVGAADGCSSAAHSPPPVSRGGSTSCLLSPLQHTAHLVVLEAARLTCQQRVSCGWQLSRPLDRRNHAGQEWIGSFQGAVAAECCKLCTVVHSILLRRCTACDTAQRSDLLLIQLHMHANRLKQACGSYPHAQCSMVCDSYFHACSVQHGLWQLLSCMLSAARSVTATAMHAQCSRISVRSQLLPQKAVHTQQLTQLLHHHNRVRGTCSQP
jgi:hypothetical protein